MDYVFETWYYGVFGDYSEAKFESLTKALEAKPRLILQWEIGPWHNGSYLNTEYRYKFYDDKGTVIREFKQGNWRIHSFEMVLDKYYQRTMLCTKVTDPMGKIQDKTFGAAMPGILELLKYLDSISKFPDWSAFQLSEQNDRLIAENQRLREENRKLRNEIALLKN